MVGTGCTTPGIRSAPHANLQAPESWPKLLAVYMPWFGNHVHMDVGYSSYDPVVLQKQIHQARSMGISGFVVDWYGSANPFSDHNFALLQQAADQNHFQVALLYNEPEDEDSQATDEAIAALDEAYTSYIGPQSPHRKTYLTYEGHPMIFIFPKEGHVDWNRVVAHCQSWESPPIFFFKDIPPSKYSADFAGSYAWVQPGKQGWTPNGSNWGQQYLEDFYRNMRNDHPDKIAIGAAWPGFNDSSAKWGLNRHMDSRCGETFEDTLHLYTHYFDAAHPLPFILIETWNDYEEGTAVERLTFSHCSQDSKSLASGS